MIAETNEKHKLLTLSPSSDLSKERVQDFFNRLEKKIREFDEQILTRKQQSGIKEVRSAIEQLQIEKSKMEQEKFEREKTLVSIIFDFFFF